MPNSRSVANASLAPHRGRLLLAGIYLAAIMAVFALFFAYRIRVHHLTFSARQFFWMGDLHRDAAMGFRMNANRSGLAVLNHGLTDPARQIPVRTDAHGLRIPVRSDPAAIRTRGIAAIGCSCTFAHGVAAESSYVEVAGALLGLPASNLGVCAYSPVTSALLLEEDVERLKPRVVVYGFGNFHLQRAATPRADSELFQAWARCPDGNCTIEAPLFDNRLAFAMAPGVERLYYAPRLAGDATPLNAARVSLLTPLAFQDLVRALHPKSLKLRVSAGPLPEAAFCRYILDRMYGTAQSHGAIFVLLWFPKEYGDRPAPGMLAAVKEFRERAGFLYVDCSAGLFAGVPDQATYSALWQVPRDGHPNKGMHAEMGRALAAAIAPALVIPPRSPEGGR